MSLVLLWSGRLRRWGLTVVDEKIRAAMSLRHRFGRGCDVPDRKAGIFRKWLRGKTLDAIWWGPPESQRWRHRIGIYGDSRKTRTDYCFLCLLFCRRGENRHFEGHRASVSARPRLHQTTSPIVGTEVLAVIHYCCSKIRSANSGGDCAGHPPKAFVAARNGTDVPSCFSPNKNAGAAVPDRNLPQTLSANGAPAPACGPITLKQGGKVRYRRVAAPN